MCRSLTSLAIRLCIIAASFSFQISYAASAADSSTVPTLSVAGDPRMLPLMKSWQVSFTRQSAEHAKVVLNNFASDAAAFPALMFETDDVAALGRSPNATELAPYAHQFAGDMMKAPLLVRVAGTLEHPAYLMVNKRPGSPLRATVTAFIRFALSPTGQTIVAQQGQFAPLDDAAAATELEKLNGYLAPLDPALPRYVPLKKVNGFVSSVGSDGMKTLMDRWMRDFRARQPMVRKGERWEHLGTLNGFHALVAGETDIAPMGRELWPAERAAYESARHQAFPLEIKVARGGFNTPQRTTAQAIFVHPSNPLAAISVRQLRDILSASPSITTWGQLGMDGEWRDRPIHVYMPPAVAPNSMSMQIMVLDGKGWNGDARQGSIAATAAAIAADPDAIGFGGLEEGSPSLKTLAVSSDERSPAVPINDETASSGTYPLTRYMYIRLNARPGSSLPAATREFLRYVLSREGQEPIRYSGYFPLSAAEAQRELAKLK